MKMFAERLGYGIPLGVYAATQHAVSWDLANLAAFMTSVKVMSRPKPSIPRIEQYDGHADRTQDSKDRGSLFTSNQFPRPQVPNASTMDGIRPYLNR